MSDPKRKLAGALMLGATLTGTIGSSATSAGLFDWFKSKETLRNKEQQKQTKGYNAAINVAKKIYELDEDKKNKDKKSKSENKSVLEILEDLVKEKEEAFIKSQKISLGEEKEESNEKSKGNDNLNALETLEKYYESKMQKLCKTTDDYYVYNTDKNTDNTNSKSKSSTESKKYKFDSKCGSESNITISGSIKSRVKILKDMCDTFSSNMKTVDYSKLIETLISIAKEDVLKQYKEKKEKPVLNLSYEDIINKLINEKMKENFLNYRSNFGEIFKPANFNDGNSQIDENSKIDEKTLASVLHELGYDKNMDWLPTFRNEEKGRVLGRLGRLAFAPVATMALGLAAAPILPFAGIAGLLCQALIYRTTSTLFNVVRHKEWSSLNPNNWEVGKFIKNVVTDFVFYGVCKYTR